MGGACAAMIGLMEFHHNVGNTGPQMAVILGMIIGSVSFSGSVIAFLKLNGTMQKPIRIPSYNILNTIILIGVLVYGGYMIFSGTSSSLLLYLLFACGIVLRNHVCNSHRWSRYAGSNFFAELVYRIGCCLRRISYTTTR